MERVRTRFAPSPTGFLHLGGARTALYNYAYARFCGGQFLLRVEDTDRERFVEGAGADIESSLKWLGLNYDEAPVIQSQNKDNHKRAAMRLVDTGHAYPCFCSVERLETMRHAQRASGKPTLYDRRCAHLSQDERARKYDENAPHTIRFRMPDGETVYEDPIRGVTRFEHSRIDDPVILKTDGFPTYHLAHVVDDHDMEISHVIRGEEWIPSIPKHIQLFRALEFKAPVYVHLPVILNPKGGKLSKRDGAVHLREYRERGYLPEAMIGFLALLGWRSSTRKDDIFSLSELCSEFDVFSVGRSSPQFHQEKLDYLNGVYLRRMGTDDLLKELLPHLHQHKDFLSSDNGKKRIHEAIPLIHERLERFDQASELLFPFLSPSLGFKDPANLVPKKGSPAQSIMILRDVCAAFRMLDAWVPEKIEGCLRAVVSDRGLSVQAVFMTVRLAGTGSPKSPPLIDSLCVIGRDWVIQRLEEAFALLSSLSSEVISDV